MRVKAYMLSGILLSMNYTLNAQNFQDINIKDQSNGKIEQANGVNGGYFYNCSGKSFWGTCNQAQDIIIDKSSAINQDFAIWGLNYSMNSDYPQQNKLTIKLGGGDFVFGGSGVDNNKNVTGVGATTYIGAYSGSTRKHFTEFKVEGIKNLYLGGTIEIGGHYMGGSIYRGGGARVTFNASGDIVSNADIRIMRGTTSGYDKGSSSLTLTGNRFISNGKITLGYTSEGATGVFYTSAFAVLDLSKVKDSIIKNLVVAGQDGYVENEYTANTIKAQNLELGTVMVRWNQANLDIKMENSDNRKDVKINLLVNSTTGNLNSGSSYTLTLKGDTRGLNIGEIKHYNAAGGETSAVVNENGNIRVDKVTFNEDGIAGSNGQISLTANNGDVIVKNAAGCGNACTGGLGIRPLNFLKIDGKNFYG
ncbi:hypothetical protein, partial [Helicobacter bilis]|uniref:hypothetical protein n=1 Tax=Helicobacter bilis TaxID=37372 RepID=UPI0010FE0007